MKSIDITIKEIEEEEGKYLAFFKSELLGATYSVYFRDNILGSVALNGF